ncbi:MAG: hypothetical protein FJ267_07525 [Planctomycetes bacterium]|nr:hypothetical protein [Planctomycetota bacterium]
MLRIHSLLFCLILFAPVSRAAEPAKTGDLKWKAGLAKSVITPKQPIWMAGYGSRTEPAEGALHDLYIRVLVLEDAHGQRGVILSSDTLGIPKSIYDDVAKQVEQQFQLKRSQILLHGSHTHCGPVLRGALYDAYPLTDSEIEKINTYSDWLTEEVVATIGRALQDLKPATVSYGIGTSDFGVNRRTNREPDVPILREQNLLMGPVDHTVPVLAVRNNDGKLMAAVFAYACHNTVLSFQKWCGDYSGFAQYDLESKHPGAMALFCMGCGADQNPIPRRSVELAETYGKKLSASVDEVLSKPMKPLSASLNMKHEFVSLTMQPLPKTEELEKMAAGAIGYSQRWANRMLKMIQSNTEIAREYPYPVSTWNLGSDLVWVALGGEVVVDYSLRLKAEHGEATMITAYANDVMAYIPSRRVLMEGGYEGQSSMMIYGLPTERWAEDVEERIAKAVGQLIESVRKGNQ